MRLWLVLGVALSGLAGSIPVAAQEPPLPPPADSIEQPRPRTAPPSAPSSPAPAEHPRPSEQPGDELFAQPEIQPPPEEPEAQPQGASDAYQRPPPPRMPRPDATGYPAGYYGAAPPPPEPPPPMRRNSPGMMAGGIVLTSLGAIGLAVGIALVDAAEPDDVDRTVCILSPCPEPVIDQDKRTAGIVSATAGIALVGAGIPLIVVGARKVPTEQGKNAGARPRIEVGGGVARLTWTF